METKEQIKIFKEFLEERYFGKDIYESSLILNFDDLKKFNNDLAEDLLNSPEEVFQAFKVSASKFDPFFPKKLVVKKLPKSQKIEISELKSNHLNKLIQVEGKLINKSDIFHRIISAKFECPSCGTVIPVMQFGEKYKEPSGCGCGRKGRFRLLSREIEDYINIKIGYTDKQKITHELNAELMIEEDEPYNKLKLNNNYSFSGILEPIFNKTTCVDKKLLINNMEYEK